MGKELLNLLKRIERVKKDARKKRNLVIRWKRMKVKVRPYSSKDRG